MNPVAPARPPRGIGNGLRGRGNRLFATTAGVFQHPGAIGDNSPGDLSPDDDFAAG